MEAKAVARYVRMSSSKLKPVTDLVRGKDLAEALTILVRHLLLRIILFLEAVVEIHLQVGT